MLLSIVRSDDHKKYKGSKIRPVVRVINEQVEIIGPVQGPNVASMRNLGVESASGEWIAFCDPDCDLDHSALVEILRENPSFDAIGGNYRSKTHSILSNTYSSIQNHWVEKGIDHTTNSKIRFGRHLLGGALVVKKSVFKKVGGFSTQVGWGAEETEWTMRLRDLGFQPGVACHWMVDHSQDLNWYEFLKRAWVQNFNHSLHKIKNDPVETSKTLKYFKGPWVEVFPKITFFATAAVARGLGRLMSKK